MTKIADFISEVRRAHRTGSATEHSYRSALQKLLEGLGNDIVALNEPRRIDCGAPDFIIQRGEIPVGHVEAKDLDVDLSKMKGDNKEQLGRYRKALPNLIYTNCLDWHFYRDGELIDSVAIAHLDANIHTIPDNYPKLESLLSNFVTQTPQFISSPRDLAERMAGKAQLIKAILYTTLQNTIEKEKKNELVRQYKAFEKNLIRDIKLEDFADIYAETVAYGMFAARLHDTTPETFSRKEALELLPKSNPFLGHLFNYIAGYDLDDRIAWIIDDLAEIFRACDVAKLMEGFGDLTGKQDPFLHFYETFLAAYNPEKRKARGVWYTPEPVVNFIVRAVDEALQTEFGLGEGLSNISKVTIEVRADDNGGESKEGNENATERQEVHQVQILDPATGTGTFLAEVIKQIAPRARSTTPDSWSRYVEEDLIPRLHGFELLMASYAMCHTKLDMILKELEYRPSPPPRRLSVYLTNSLEESKHTNPELPFARWLSGEAEGANRIKRDMPIMCIIGNPPYLARSRNMGKWISDMIEDYKYVNGVHFNERRHWLHDDYVKFIRLSESLIEKNGRGVLGFITNHGYLDNPTFRGMRWHLMQTFDKLWVLDLHGNKRKREIPPQGKTDENVFDIQQGVSIIIAVKTGDGNGKLADVRHGELWGEREEKYKSLRDGGFELFSSKLDPSAPQYLLKPYDKKVAAQYEKGFSIKELFLSGGVGLITGRDEIALQETEASAFRIIRDILSSPEGVAQKKYDLPSTAMSDLKQSKGKISIKPVAYRPFDDKFAYYSGRAEGFITRPRRKIMKHFVRGANIGLATARSNKSSIPDHFFVVDKMMEAKCAERSTQSSVFPLYIYNGDDLYEHRKPNFDAAVFEKIQKNSEHTKYGVPDEVAVFDYIYGVLYCPEFRRIFAEFLKRDFPRIPQPSNPDEFWDVSKKGTQLRKLHLMELAAVGDTPYPFMGEGDGLVSRVKFKDKKVWINETQHFENAPEVSWDFSIGGYQPARKWLKDRKGRKLSHGDLQHYQRILKILAETDRIMNTIHMSFEA